MNQLSTQAQAKERSQKLAEFLDNKADDFKSVMVIEPGRFMRMVKNSILRDPQIAEATTQSVFLECMKAAADGLVLDGREATLTRFKTNKRIKKDGRWVDNWQTEVAYIPMVAGIMKRVRNSGEIQSWRVGLVYQKEYETGKFNYVAAPVEDMRHEPIIVGERGPVVAAYSAVRLKDGSIHYEVMRRDELDAIKNRTKSKKTITENGQDKTVITGPWATDEEEMFKKTVIRRHSKRLPVSSEVMDVAQRIDALYDRDTDSYVVDESSVPEPKPVASRRSSSAADRLRQAQAERDAQARREATDVDPDDVGQDQDEDGDQDQGEESHDPDTGEILEGEIIKPTEEKKPTASKKKEPEINPDDEF